MEIAKALILAGQGDDHRPSPAAPGGSAHLFPLANRPILFHNLEAMNAAGVLEVAILTDGDCGEAIRSAVGDGRQWRLNIRYAEWQTSSGLAGALDAAHDFMRDEPVLVQEGGALLRGRMHTHISRFARDWLDTLALRIPPHGDRSAPALTPGYLLSNRAVDILLNDAEPGDDPVDDVRHGGGRVQIQQVDGCVPSPRHVETLIEGNRCVLEGLTASSSADSFDDCTIQGPVHVHPTARLERTVLRGPIVIGPGARISDAYVGPYTSIGADVTIEGAQIEHSIVLPEAELRFVGTRLESSLIGRGARVIRGFQLPDAIRVSIGDGAEVVLH